MPKRLLLVMRSLSKLDRHQSAGGKALPIAEVANPTILLQGLDPVQDGARLRKSSVSNTHARMMMGSYESIVEYPYPESTAPNPARQTRTAGAA